MSSRLPGIFWVSFFLALGTALFVPIAFGDWVRGSLQFVLWPARLLHDATSRLDSTASNVGSITIDPSTPAGEQVRLLTDENARLSQQVAVLTTQLQAVTVRLSEQDRLAVEGEKGLSMARVVGSDSGGRDVVSIVSSAGSVGGGYEINQAAIYSGGVAGKISRVGVAGQAQLRLITDRDAKLTGIFGRFENASFKRLSLEPIVVEGMGKNEMRVSLLKSPDVTASGLKLGDWVVLHEDPQWPAALQGRKVGVVSYIGQRQDATGFAEVRVRPESNLLQLREVTVVTGQVK